MNIVATFDPAQNTSGTATAITTGKVVCYNESNINLIFTFGNGHSEYAPAWTAVIFCGPFGSPNFQWNRQATLVTGSGPISQIILVAYEHNEFVPGTFPSPLVRQTNIGNSIPVSTSSTSIVNDGSIATTPIIESTVSGGPSSNVSIDNSGNMFLAQTVAGVVTKLFQTVANAATAVLLGALGKTVEVLGSLKVDQSVGIHGNPNATIGLTIDPGNDANKGLVIFAHSATQSANLLEVQNSAFVPQFQVIPAGNVVLANNNPLQFKDSGGIARTGIVVDGSNVLNIRQMANNSPVTILDNAGNPLFQFGGDGNITLLNNKGIFIKDNGGTARPVIFVDGSGTTIIRQAANASNLVYQDNAGVNLMHIDSAGAMVLKSTLTQNGAP